MNHRILSGVGQEQQILPLPDSVPWRYVFDLSTGLCNTRLGCTAAPTHPLAQIMLDFSASVSKHRQSLPMLQKDGVDLNINLQGAKLEKGVEHASLSYRGTS